MKYMIERIKNIINNGNLEDITLEECDIIANDNVLLELFKEKLKKHNNYEFIQNISDELSKKIVFLSEFLEKIFDSLMEINSNSLIDFIIDGSYQINYLSQMGFEIDDYTEQTLNNYKIKIIPNIIEMCKNNDFFIKDKFLNNYIIKNNIYILANNIDSSTLDEIPPEFDQFIIEANTNYNPIKLISYVNENIINKLIDNNKVYKISKYALCEFIEQYPEYKESIDKSLALFLKSATEEELNPHNYCLMYITDNKTLRNSLLTRLTQINSNLINTDYYRFRFHLGINDYFDKLLFDPNNPLRIDFNTYMYYFENKVDDKNIDLLIDSIQIKNELYLQYIDEFFSKLTFLHDNKIQYIFKLFINKANFDKISFYRFFSRYHKIDDKIWIEYFKRQDNVPIDIFEKLKQGNNDFDIEEAINHVLNNCDEDYYIYDFSLFKDINNNSKRMLYNKIIERLKSNKQVNFYYFLTFINSNIDIDYNYLNSPNILFRLDSDTINEIILFIYRKNTDSKFSSILINKLKNCNEEIPIDLFQFDIIDNQLFKPILLEFIANKKVNISNLINSKLYLNKDILINILNVNQCYIKEIIINIIHNENTEDITPLLFDIMLPSILNIYNINKDKFLKLKNVYGIKTISLLENQQFINMLNYSNEELDKFTLLFKVRKFDKNLIVAINDSLRQNIFAKEHQDILTIYTTIMESIQTGINDDKLTHYIEELIPHTSNLNLKDSLIKYYNSLDIDNNLKQQYINNIDDKLIDLYNNDKKLFFVELFKLLKENQNIYGTYLHIITNKYIFDKRNEFSKNNDIFKDTDVKYEYDKKSLIDNFFNYLLKNNISLLREILIDYDTYNDYWEEDFKIDEENQQIINKTIDYLLNPSMIQSLSKDEILKIKQNIKWLKIKFYNKCSSLKIVNNSNNMLSININDRVKLIAVDFLDKTKKEIDIEERNLDITEIFKNINIEVLFNTIIDNPNKYNVLLSIIDKYKILEWNNIFNPAVEKLSVGSDNGIFTFIDAFDKIFDQEVKIVKGAIDEQIEIMKKKGISEDDIMKYKKEHSKISFNPYKILKYCSIYSGFANCYKVILGLEDYELIKNNEEPYSAKASTQERLDDTTKLQISMFNQQEITIPSFIRSYDITDDKLMAIVGNRCASFNLTHGERTGACMRSKGYADSLFNFCNTDARGFHITFIDPKANEYVSRVSGFRNGNTVFLNQLRYSVLSKYSDDDVIKACKEVSKELIELSKESIMPIENVVVSPSYALEGAETMELSEINIGNKVYNGYRDVSQNAVILATTSEDGKPVPLKLNPNQPKYQPVRLPVLEYDKCDLKTHINIQRIKCLKECIINNNDKEFYQKIDIDVNELETNYLRIFLGQDWFVTIDENYNIEYAIILGDERAKQELDEAIKNANLIKEKHIGGKVR